MLPQVAGAPHAARAGGIVDAMRMTTWARLVLVVASVGCGGSPSGAGVDAGGGDGGAGGGSADGGGTAPCTPAELRDDFSAPALDPATWRTVGFSGWTVQVVAGQLALAPVPGHANTRTGLVLSRASMDLTGCATWLELPRVLPPDLTGEVTISFSASGTSLGLMRARRGMLQLVIDTAGGPEERFTPYDPVAHRWWQVREAGGVLHLETSPDAQTWTEQLQRPHGVDVSAVVLSFGAIDTSLTDGFDGPLFDNVNVVP